MSLIAIDIETTGLNPSQGVVLEIAAYELDDNLNQTGRSFNGINKALLRYNPLAWAYVLANDTLYLDGTSMGVLKMRELDVATVDGYVLNMHTDNGLWEECANGDPYMLTRFSEWMAQFSKPILFGSSVHFDKHWLEYHMEINDLPFDIGYRIVDVSSFVGLMDCCPEGLKAHGQAAHRAVDDILRSIEIGRFYLELLQRGLVA